MVQDSNVERMISEAISPLTKEIKELKRQIEALKQVNEFAIPAVMGELACDRCGCHPTVLYTTEKGRFCISCKPAS